MDVSTVLLLLAIGLIAGIAGGFVGIGGGLIIVPALVYGLGLTQHMAQGTSLAITFVLGAWLGSRWSMKISPTIVRLIFALFMMFAAIQMGLKSWAELTEKTGS